MRVILIGCILLGLIGDALADDVPMQPGKVTDLLELLQDPEVRTLLESKPGARTEAVILPADPADIVRWEEETRRRIDGVIDAVPRVPAEVAAAAGRVWADAVGHHFAPAFVVFTLLLLIGASVEILFRRTILKRTMEYAKLRPLEAAAISDLLPVFVFAAAMAIVFFGFDWPSLERIALLIFLTAFTLYRVLYTAVCIAMPPNHLRRRIHLFLGIVTLAVACASLGRPLLVPGEVQEAISLLFSGVLLLLATEAVWRALYCRWSMKTALTCALVALWLLWCLGLPGLFWIGIYALALPGTLSVVGRAAESYSAPSRGQQQDIRRMLIVRGSRAVVVAVAVAWLAAVWRYSPTSLANQHPAVAAFLYGLLKSVAVVLMADLLWNLAKVMIDGKFAASGIATGLAPGELARRSRLRTLLPIFRNGLAALVIVTTGMIVLSELGVEIAPLVAGAGIFGVALGFGSQTLVKDVISGVFYMLDDAFRVGEYIQSGSYKGTVESFSMRSVRLRHHRGPVFTVPFGMLGAVQNMSRDWGVVKFRISVAYDTDVEKARKLTKRIGAGLIEDPELGPLFIEPLKMKGLEEFGGQGVVLGFGMTLRPSPMQSFVRRRANLLLREAFMRNGIDFAPPNVQGGNLHVTVRETTAAAGTKLS